MKQLSERYLHLELNEDIFKDIKYFITGEVHDKIDTFLKSGGAERQNYFSDYVTHLIVGTNPEENDVADAKDVYEIPAVTDQWVVLSAFLRRRLDVTPYLYSCEPPIFSGFTFCLSQIPPEDRVTLWGMLTLNGGKVFLRLTSACNFLVCGGTDGMKYDKAMSLGPEHIRVVTPDWVYESVRSRKLVDPALFHPKLINWPKPIKPTESTTAITGFEPDIPENETKLEEKASDSTQALLEKLKQRMPWNQPTSAVTPSSSSDPVAPPNVVAPSFLSKLQRDQFKPLPQQVPTNFNQANLPRSTIHHTPNSQQQQQSININRMMGMSQNQPPAQRMNSLQQLRGQLNTSQIQQQLLQQRIQQNVAQRQNSAGQVNMLHQQLTQGQRQVLQNQLMTNQQQNLLGQQQGMINQPGQSPIREPQDNQLMGQQSSQQFAQQPNQQQMDMGHLRNQLDRSPSQNQIMSSPQHTQGQLLSPQHQMQQNQLVHQQSNQQMINQQQIQNQLLNQQQQSQAGPMQSNQIMNQQQNQLMQQRDDMQTQQQQLMQQHPNQQMMQQNQQLMQQSQLSPQLLQQQNQMLPQQNQQLIQQNPQLNQQLGTQQQGTIIRQSQLINQQTQQLMTQQGNQQQHPHNQQTLLSLPPNHHLSQLSPQQMQQLQQLKREQQQLLNQSQNQMNQGLNQPNQQIIGGPNQQQLMQNRVIQQQSTSGQAQNFNQHVLTQNQQQLFSQQQQQQPNIVQGQQPQFVNQVGQFEAVQQQQQQQQPPNQQMNVQTLNQQLQQQNFGQQLNQQLMQQNQAGQGMAIDQQGLINQQAQPMNPGINQQVIRQQFPQQVLVNQPGGQRPQLNQQQIWSQQQQQQGQGQQVIRQPVNVAVRQNPNGGPRLQWPPGQQQGVPQRQLIHLDAHTHNQLQKMPREQQALFVARLQEKQRQLAKQAQQRGGSGHIFIRGNVPQGLTPQQQVQWLQQQAKQQGIMLPSNIQQNLTPGNPASQPNASPNAVSAPGPSVQHAPGLSPINQPISSAVPPQQPFVGGAGDQGANQPMHVRQQFRIQQLQLQREQAQKNALAQPTGGIPAQTMVRPPLGQPPPAVVDPPPAAAIHSQVQVNPKTKTALANMLSIKLQSGGTIGAPVRPEGIQETSAAGALRMMTAQHNAAINSKPQEIMAIHQRRIISGPNGEIIKPPSGAVPALPINTPNEPPKLQFNQKAPVPVQHRVGPFYGHNPNLKLPPDLFLLGCIFVVVEVEDYLEEKLPGWQQKIEKYGGEVEKQYCLKVTHVLCETQRHGVVMQALRDMKRCVTIRWLSDVIKRKQVLPPWTALHLPQIYLDITPASKHLISISGFENNVRQLVKQMILYTGAKCTNYFSKHNTLLICAKAEGKKYNHAKKWGIPVVNVQWLTDIILGNFTALNQTDNQVYQTYTNPPNFSFDPKLVPNMMHAWKAPINISQESYERVKRSASPVSLPKAKKQKTEHVDENENVTNEEAANSNYKVLLSQFDTKRTKELEKLVRELGGVVAKDHKDFTHLVVPKLVRTHKLLFAIVRSCHILPAKWLENSYGAKTFLPETDFPLPTDEFNRTYGVYLEKVLQSPIKNRIFDGKSFWITPSVFPKKRILAELIELCGGRLERIRRSRSQIEATSMTPPLTYFIITAKEDLHLVADLLKNKKDKQRVVCNVELVLSAILRQEVQADSYAVSVV